MDKTTGKAQLGFRTGRSVRYNVRRQAILNAPDLPAQRPSNRPVPEESRHRWDEKVATSTARTLSKPWPVVSKSRVRTLKPAARFKSGIDPTRPLSYQMYLRYMRVGCTHARQLAISASTCARSIIPASEPNPLATKDADAVPRCAASSRLRPSTNPAMCGFGSTRGSTLHAEHEGCATGFRIQVKSLHPLLESVERKHAEGDANAGYATADEVLPAR